MRPLFSILPFLLASATDPATPGAPPTTGGAAEAVDPAEALKAIQDKTLPMSQRLDVAFKALKGIDPTNQLAAVKQKLADAEALVKTRDGELATANDALAAAKKELAAREADVKNLEASNAQLALANKDLAAKEQSIDKRATAMANEKVAALGFPAGKLPAANDEIPGDVPQTEEQLEEALKKCKTQQERSAMLREFRAAKLKQ